MKIKAAKYVKARLEGKNQEQAGLEAGATTIEGARKLATRLSKNVQVKQALENSQFTALAEAGISLKKAYQRIVEGMDAVKQNTFTGEITEDHSTRLKATDMALKLLKEIPPESPEQTVSYPNLSNSMNEVELSQIVFRKNQV